MENTRGGEKIKGEKKKSKKKKGPEGQEGALKRRHTTDLKPESHEKEKTGRRKKKRSIIQRTVRDQKKRGEVLGSSLRGEVAFLKEKYNGTRWTSPKKRLTNKITKKKKGGERRANKQPMSSGKK